MENSVGIIILAGGKSNRMGTDKGLIEVHHKAIVEYLLETCKLISNNIIIISNNDAYKKFGYPVYSDLKPLCGPMGGLLTGLTYSKFQQNIVVSCDVPLVSKKLLQALLAAATVSDQIIVAKHGEQHHPLIGMYDYHVINTIKKLIELKRFKMANLYELKSAKVLDVSHFPEKEFLNLNTRDDLANFKAFLNDS